MRPWNNDAYNIVSPPTNTQAFSIFQFYLLVNRAHAVSESRQLLIDCFYLTPVNVHTTSNFTSEQQTRNVPPFHNVTSSSTVSGGHVAVMYLPAMSASGPPSLISLLFLLAAALLQFALASTGVVDIPELLTPKDDAHLGSNNGSQRLPSKGSKSSLWTHKPFCATTANQKKYCARTHLRPEPKDPISIISTASLASSIVANLDEDPLISFLSVADEEKWHRTERPYKVVHVPGKGKAVVATRAIKQYETFMIEQAVLVVEMEAQGGLEKTKYHEVLEVAVDRLADPKVVLELSDEHGEEKEGSVVADIMITNAFGTLVGGAETWGLFPLLSVSAILVPE